jgi:hypothetical protein
LGKIVISEIYANLKVRNSEGGLRDGGETGRGNKRITKIGKET